MIKHRNENVDIVFTPEVDGIGAEYDNFTKDGGGSEIMGSGDSFDIYIFDLSLS